MKFIDVSNPIKKVIRARDVPVGNLFKDAQTGDIYVRSQYTIFCLNKVGNTFSNDSGKPGPVDMYVEILPKGYQITLEQE